MENVPTTISLTREQANNILQLYDNLEAADAHFKTCQSELFRSFAKDTIRARNIESAIASLRHQVKAMDVQEGETNVR